MPMDFGYDFSEIQKAIHILQNEILKHEDIYDAFVASVESSLREQKVSSLPFQPAHEIAEKIVMRISGEE